MRCCDETNLGPTQYRHIDTRINVDLVFAYCVCFQLGDLPKEEEQDEQEQEERAVP